MSESGYGGHGGPQNPIEVPPGLNVTNSSFFLTDSGLHYYKNDISANVFAIKSRR